MYSGFHGFHRRKPCKPPPKINFLSVVLILVGVLLVFFYTPPWVWCFLFGLGLVLAGVLSLKK
jgi:Sec-independent protein secretion pathway component TatC